MIKKIIKKETILYGIFGIFTSILNVILFYLLVSIKLDYKISNIITLIVVKVTAYLCNKHFVFHSKCENYHELVKELERFFIWRGITMIIDYIGLIFLVEILNINKLIGKIIVTVTVIIINYITGKKYVFLSSKNY